MKARCDLNFFLSSRSTLVSVQRVNTGLYNQDYDTITKIHPVASFSEERQNNKTSQTRGHCIKHMTTY